MAGRPHLQLVLLHGVLQCGQKVSVLFLQAGHLALQGQQCPLIFLRGRERGFRDSPDGQSCLSLGHWVLSALPGSPEPYLLLCSKPCLQWESQTAPGLWSLLKAIWAIFIVNICIVLF